jgi:hypothetical protein
MTGTIVRMNKNQFLIPKSVVIIGKKAEKWPRFVRVYIVGYWVTVELDN